ncbi:MAG: seg [candidate division WS6 bacterium 34_10]|uniref:Seg n=1 Tax=candidate division WS6 bacterium 34_10 TaxID=1641389 RepID=A0A101HHM7_9BACT|nr:MAG: seg [candidate division WS6 bacterium 34_10]
MKKFFLLLLLSILIIYPSYSFAQETESEELTPQVQYFDIEMQRLGQSAWNKDVTYEIYVTPRIDSPETQIIWDAPKAIDISPKHPEFVDLYKGQTYTFRAKVKSNKAGKYEITANLIAWQHDTNYTSSVTDIVTFDNDLLVQPVDSSYKVNLIIKYLIIFLLIGGATYIAVIYLKKGLEKLKVWLTPPA